MIYSLRFILIRLAFVLLVQIYAINLVFFADPDGMRLDHTLPQTFAIEDEKMPGSHEPSYLAETFETDTVSIQGRVPHFFTYQADSCALGTPNCLPDSSEAPAQARNSIASTSKNALTDPHNLQAASRQSIALSDQHLLDE